MYNIYFATLTFANCRNSFAYNKIETFDHLILRLVNYVKVVLLPNIIYLHQIRHNKNSKFSLSQEIYQLL